MSTQLSLDLTSSLGLEVMSKQALAILRENLNAKIVAMTANWDTLDNLMGYRPVTVEHVDSANFYYGHRPSLVDAEMERYPNCSVMAYQTTPAAEGEALDHENVHVVTMYVELMCKGDEEGQVNSRIARTADAVHAVLMDYADLKGLVVAIGNQPSMVLTDLFVRPEHDGKRFMWQGARLDYRVTKYSGR